MWIIDGEFSLRSRKTLIPCRGSMTFASLLPDIASPSHRCFRDGDAPCDDPRRRVPRYRSAAFLSLLLQTAGRRPISSSSSGIFLLTNRHSGRIWRLSASTLRDVDYTVNAQASTSAGIEIPVSCYQIIGVSDQAEKDEIVKSVMDLRNTEVEEGYTMEVVMARKDLLLDIRDKLLFEQVYAGNTREKIPPKSSLRIPWTWLPGALCLLQEVGEEKLVLEIGRAALQHPEVKPYFHDLILAMALAECAIAKTHFEKNQISQGFEALARAQCLLKSKASLEKMKLLSQIQESLEELAPACTLELLGMPHTPENSERRRGAMAALRELIRQGLDAESSPQVHDWPCFLGQALNRLMAAEIVDLLPWDSLASVRKNKKSLESQNQRVIIDLDCFHVVLRAHIALGFSSKRTDLIGRAKAICECLMVAEGIDLKFEESFCLFLLGQGNEAEAIERLNQIESRSNSNSSSQSSLLGKEDKDVTPVNPPLERWLKDAVLGLFSDTQDCSPSLAVFFDRERKPMVSKQNKGLQPSIFRAGFRPLSPSVSSMRRISDEQHITLTSSQYLGPAVKELASPNLQIQPPDSKPNDQSNSSSFSSQLQRNIGAHNNKSIEIWSNPRDIIQRIAFVAVVGCIVFVASKVFVRPGRMSSTRLDKDRPSFTTRSTLSDYNGHIGSKSSFGNCIKEQMSKFIMKIGSSSILIGRRKPLSPASLSSPLHAACCRPMAVAEAEALVRQWQNIKAKVLGPDHQTQLLYDILDEPMLLQWIDLADSAKAKSCFWKFVLLQLSILRAEIFLDKVNPERAEIEVLLEEAAELVDKHQLKNPTYYSTYKIRYVLEKQDDETWKFCEADIQPQM